jgi:anti-sigma B factor antagonist
MTETNATVTVRQASEHIYVLDIEGEITLSAEGVLSSAYGKATDAGARVVLLNFDKMTYMNSSGIGLLVTLLIRAQRQGQRLLACGLSEHYRHIFDITQLNAAIKIYDSESDALGAASGP